MKKLVALSLLGFKETDNPTPKQVEEAYKLVAQMNHPDKYAKKDLKAKAEELMKQVNEARHVLINKTWEVENKSYTTQSSQWSPPQWPPPQWPPPKGSPAPRTRSVKSPEYVAAQVVAPNEYYFVLSEKQYRQKLFSLVLCIVLAILAAFVPVYIIVTGAEFWAQEFEVGQKVLFAVLLFSFGFVFFYPMFLLLRTIFSSLSQQPCCSATIFGVLAVLFVPIFSTALITYPLTFLTNFFVEHLELGEDGSFIASVVLVVFGLLLCVVGTIRHIKKLSK